MLSLRALHVYIFFCLSLCITKVYVTLTKYGKLCACHTFSFALHVLQIHNSAILAAHLACLLCMLCIISMLTYCLQPCVDQ